MATVLHTQRLVQVQQQSVFCLSGFLYLLLSRCFPSSISKPMQALRGENFKFYLRKKTPTCHFMPQLPGQGWARVSQELGTLASSPVWEVGAQFLEPSPAASPERILAGSRDQAQSWDSDPGTLLWALVSRAGS